jgi:hypothetical protein
MTITILFVGMRLSTKGWDLAAIAELGTMYQHGDPNGTEGYDGQFAYYIAINPDPNEVFTQLDVPAYRYQRILYPFLARIVGLGNPDFIPWTLIAVNMIAHLAATSILCRFLSENGLPSKYALIYGLWVGIILGIGADLYEPLAYAFLVATLYFREQAKFVRSNIFLLLALFTKETAIPFWIAFVFTDLLKRKPVKSVFQTFLPGLVYGFWQFWLFIQFGTFGLTSGGAMATSFEFIPYGGFIRIANAGADVFLLFLVIFLPTIILPNLWGTLDSVRKLLGGDLSYVNIAMFFNTLFITFLPFSTFREPLGLLRVATGLITVFLFYATYNKQRRQLNYGMFWIFLLVILIQQ